MMSRIREAHRLEVLRREFRREVQEARKEHGLTWPEPLDAGGPEVDDLPLGVPSEPAEGDELELPGFPRGDPSHG